MAKSRDDRPVNAAAMRAALRDTLQGAQQRGVSPGVGATRVAEPSWGNAPAAPVGLASRDELPATRIAASQPAQSVDGIPATRFAGSAAIAPARREGRPWLVGVAVCIAVGAGAATYRSVTREVEYGGVYPAQKEAGGSRPTDTLRVSTPVTGPATDAPTREPVRLPVVGSLQEVGGGTSTPKTPPSGSGGQTVVTPVAPRRAERPTEPPKSEAPKGDSPKGAAPGDVGAMPPAASPPTESAKAESGFRNAVAKQVEVFAQAIRDRDVDTVEQLLSASGTNRSVHNQLVALLQAGRVEVSDVNVTNRSRDDESGAAQFGATLNFRSPFGANRKTDTQFSIALVRASGGWSLASAQVIGSPKFR